MKTLHNKNLVPTDKSGQRMKSFFTRWVISIRWKIFFLFFFFISLSFFLFLGCGSSEIKPVDIYPEDMCSHCRMAISDQAFASEIITEAGEVFKFDDLGCMGKFKEKSTDLKIATTFVKDYETKNWLPYERSTIVQTSIRTPMGSGKVALADSLKAREFSEKFPVSGR
ncbi:nitrous oxide reductase accessory protein NosL [candidate division KSB1 bacterium]|nr:nitrous oxide reductase accessory protein NosL [candidate division KSB1 bacterium]